MKIEMRRGLPGGRAVAGGLLMALAAIGVFLAYTQATKRETGHVVVTTSALRAGEVIEPDDLRTIEADVGEAGSAAFASIDEAVGRVTLAAIAEGEIVQSGAVTDDLAADPAHEVALVLPRGQLAVGRLRAGERVDVFVSTDAATRSVTRGAVVIDVGDGDDTSLTGDRDVTLVIAVPSGDEVAALVHALRTGDVTVVRSTLAAPGGAPLEYAAAESR